VPAGAGRVFVTVWPMLRLEALQIEATGAPLHLSIEVPPPKKEGWADLLKKILPRG
jgi:hypothetical protein